MFNKSHYKCSFCGKTQNQVRKLIAGPDVYICDGCIDLCNEIILEELEEECLAAVRTCSRHHLGHAAKVAANNVRLLPGEDPELSTFDPPGLEGLEIAVI